MNNAVAEMLQKNERVIVPDFGAFMKKKDSDIIYFNEYLKFNDNVFINYIAERDNIEKAAAGQKVQDYITHIRSTLDEGHDYVVNGVGTITKDDKGRLQFSTSASKMAENTSVSVPSAFELSDNAPDDLPEPIPEPPVEVPSVSLPPAEPDSFVLEDEKVPEMPPEPENKPADDIQAAPVEESAPADEPLPEIQPEPEPVVDQVAAVTEQVPEPPPQTVSEMPEAEAPVEVSESEIPPVAVIDDTVAAPVEETQKVTDSKTAKDKKEQKDQKAVKDKKAKPPRPPKPPKKKKAKDDGGKKKSKWWLWLIIIIVVLAAAAAALGYFKPDLVCKYVNISFLKCEQYVAPADTVKIEQKLPDQGTADADTLSVETDTLGITSDSTLTEADTLTGEEIEQVETNEVEETVTSTTPVSTTTSTSSNYSSGSGGKQYYVVAGCFENEANADKLVAKLYGEGHSSARKFGKVGRLFGVCYSSHGTGQEAKAELSKLGTGQAWVLYK